VTDAPSAGPAESHGPVRLDLSGPNEINRWRPLFQWLLAIPHFLILWVLGVLASVCLFVAFFTVLFTKAIPDQLFGLIVMTYRYSWRVTSYALWMREEYPPFDFTATPEDNGMDPPTVVEIQYPSELMRFGPLFKWFLAIPHFVVIWFLGIGAIFVGIWAFFAVLFTGRYPAGARDYLVGLQRWMLRVQAYAAFLRDEYPPFSMN
jgi:hypothetical protein